MDRASAAAAIAALFEDGGATILAEAGGAQTWSEVLAAMPDGLFQIESETPAVAMLSVARDLWNRAGDLRTATAVTRGLLGWMVQNRGPEHPDTFVELGALGFLAQRAGREQEGAEAMERAYHGLRSVVGGRDIRLAVVAGNLGLHYARNGDLERGDHVLEQAYRIRKITAPETLGNVAAQLAEVRLRLGKIQDALGCLRDAWMAELDEHGEHHPRTVARARVLATALNRVGEYREAVATWRSLDSIAHQADPATQAEIGFQLGVSLYHTHKREEAIRRVEQAVQLTRTLEGTHATLPERLTFFAQIQIDARRADEAESMLYEAAELQRRISGDSSPEAARRFARLGGLIAQLGRLDEAMGYLDSASSLLRSALGDDDPDAQLAVEGTVDVLAQKAAILLQQGERREATSLIVHARGLADAVLGPDHPSALTLKKLVMDHRLRI